MKNPLSLEAFADWCEKQPKDKTYRYVEPTECACAQYAKFLGIQNWIGAAGAGSFWGRADYEAFYGHRNFGALAARLREASKAEAST